MRLEIQVLVHTVPYACLLPTSGDEEWEFVITTSVGEKEIELRPVTGETSLRTSTKILWSH